MTKDIKSALYYSKGLEYFDVIVFQVCDWNYPFICFNKFGQKLCQTIKAMITQRWLNNPTVTEA